jgi:hypothetical protein
MINPNLLMSYLTCPDVCRPELWPPPPCSDKCWARTDRCLTCPDECRPGLWPPPPCSDKCWARELTAVSPVLMCVGQCCGRRPHVVTNAGPELTAVSPVLMCVGQSCGRRPHVMTNAGPELTTVSQQPDANRPIVAHRDHAVFP